MLLLGFSRFGGTDKEIKCSRPKSSAFTLAEVLITLGIIGVVAAMTLPTVINDTQNKHFVVGLKKAYSILSQANEMVQIENPSYTWDNLKDDDTNSTKALFAYYKPYFKIVKDCGCSYKPTGCWSDDATKALNNVKYTNSGEGYIGAHTCSLRLADGTNLSFDFWGNGNSSLGVDYLGVDYTKTLPYFYIDVNGDKKPNTLGKDVFLFAIRPDKGILVPAGIDNESERCSPDVSGGLSGIDCAAKVLNEGKISY